MKSTIIIIFIVFTCIQQYIIVGERATSARFEHALNLCMQWSDK